MSRKIHWMIIVAIGISLLPVYLSAAQGGGWSETFDDPALPGWSIRPACLSWTACCASNRATSRRTAATGRTSPSRSRCDCPVPAVWP